MIRRFFCHAVKTKIRHRPQSANPTNLNKYKTNLAWMEKKMKIIKPNSGFTTCDASEFSKAMEDAADKELFSFYNK